MLSVTVKLTITESPVFPVVGSDTEAYSGGSSSVTVIVLSIVVLLFPAASLNVQLYLIGSVESVGMFIV